MVSKMHRPTTAAVASLLVLCTLASSLITAAATPHQRRAFEEQPSTADAVQIVTHAPGFVRATSDDEMEQLYQDNLLPDLEPFKVQGVRSTKDFEQYILTFRDKVLHHAFKGAIVGLVVVKNNTVNIHWMKGADPHWRFACLKAAVEQSSELKFPDTAFILSMQDFPICQEGRCSLPVFAMFKKWRNGQNLDSNEVLLPVFNHDFEHLYMYPWEKKQPKAMMRASQHSCMPVNSSRVALTLAGQAYPQYLDLGVTHIDPSAKKVYKNKLVKSNRIELEQHARWRYLVTADGCVASTRLAKVMLSDSVVMKEESDWIEHYYRSLKPWEHYVPFRADNKDLGGHLADIVKQLEDDNQTAQALVDKAQHWAYKYLSKYPRLLYLRRLLQEYNKLFDGEMESWVSAGGAQQLIRRLEQAEQQHDKKPDKVVTKHRHFRHVARTPGVNALPIKRTVD